MSTFPFWRVQLYETGALWDIGDWSVEHLIVFFVFMYCQTCNIRRTLVGIKNVDHSDVVVASLVGAAPTTSSFST